MSNGIGNSVFTNTKKEGNGGIANGARNGASVSGGFVEVGGNPLIHNTSINQAGFLFELLEVADRLFSIDPTAGLYMIGRIDGGNGNFLEIDDAVNRIQTVMPGNAVGISLDGATAVSRIGDVAGAGFGLLLDINDTNQTAEIADSTGRMLSLDNQAFLYGIGDLDAAGNGTFLTIDDTVQVAEIIAGINKMLSLDYLNGLFQIGDISDSVNGTKIQISDVSQEILIKDGSLATAVNGDVMTLINQATGAIGWATGGGGGATSGAFTATPLANSGTIVSVNQIEIFYNQIGSFVFGNGFADIDTNGAGTGAFRFDLPVASNFSGAGQAFLVGSGQTLTRATGFSNAADDSISVTVTSTTNTNLNMTFSFAYQVI